MCYRSCLQPYLKSYKRHMQFLIRICTFVFLRYYWKCKLDVAYFSHWDWGGGKHAVHASLQLLSKLCLDLKIKTVSKPQHAVLQQKLRRVYNHGNHPVLSVLSVHLTNSCFSWPSALPAGLPQRCGVGISAKSLYHFEFFASPGAQASLAAV